MVSSLPGRRTLGGTGPRAARILDLAGMDYTLHLASSGPEIRGLLPAGPEYLSHSSSGISHPHVIVQFDRGATVCLDGRTITAPRDNRLIFVHDPDNESLKIATDLAIAVADADIWLVSGLNAVRESDVLDERIEEITDLAASARPGTWILYEDAGFHDRDLADRAMAGMARFAHIVSMNEDEFQIRAGPVDLADPASVGAAFASLRQMLGLPTIVVHTAGWAAATGPDAMGLRPALVEGVVAAGARYVAGDAMNLATIAEIRASPVNTAGAGLIDGLQRGFPEVIGVPALDLHPVTGTTVGLGDSFVGGFVVGLAQSGARPGAPAQAQAQAKVQVQVQVRASAPWRSKP
jgi:ADP-dependent phosphofructokinase/glucokinase